MLGKHQLVRGLSAMLKKYLYSIAVFGVVLSALGGFAWVNELHAASSEPKPIAGKITPATVADTPKLTTINDRIYFAGQPTAAGILGFREKGVKTIINFRTEDEMKALDFKEAQLAESLGIEYINVPIGRDELSEEQVGKLLNLIEEKSDEPLLMHCGTSVRVGYVWAMYQGTKGGLSKEAALEQGKQAGMSSPAYVERAASFLDRMK